MLASPPFYIITTIANATMIITTAMNTAASLFDISHMACSIADAFVGWAAATFLYSDNDRSAHASSSSHSSHSVGCLLMKEVTPRCIARA